MDIDSFGVDAGCSGVGGVALIEFFRSIGSFLSTVVDIVVSAIQNFVFAVTQMPTYLRMFVSSFRLVPPTLAGLFVAAVGVLIAWFLVGRT